VRLGSELEPTLKVTIVPEQELAALLAEREAEDAPQQDGAGEDELAVAADAAAGNGEATP